MQLNIFYKLEDYLIYISCCLNYYMYIYLHNNFYIIHFSCISRVSCNKNCIFIHVFTEAKQNSQINFLFNDSFLSTGNNKHNETVILQLSFMSVDII